MPDFLSKSVQSIPPSGIRRFFDLVMQAGDEIISLGVGEPDFPTPWHIRESAIFGLEKGFTSYSENAGLLELREAISHYHKDQTTHTYNSQNEILVTNGVSEGIDLALRATLNPGEKVLVPDPGFVCYDSLVRLAGGIPIPYNPLKLQEELTKIIQNFHSNKGDQVGLKSIILNFPGNPLGNTFTEEDLQFLTKIAQEKNILLLSDEIYAELSFDTPHKSLIEIPEAIPYTLLFGGVSKSHAMTGLRIGWACGPEEIISSMNKIHQYSAMCAGSINQLATIEALKRGQKSVQEMTRQYKKRRNFCLKKLEELNIPTPHPGGAFYLFPDISASGLDEVTFCERLLEEAKCAIVPGSAFGENGKNHVRMTYAASMEELEEFFRRFEKFWGKVTPPSK